MSVDREHVMLPDLPHFSHRRAGAPLALSSLSLSVANRKGEEESGGRRKRERKKKQRNSYRQVGPYKPPVRTLRLPWGHSRFTIPDVEPLVVKSGKTQTQGRSAAPSTPRLNAYNGRSFTIPSASTARLTVSSRALCDLNSSATTHSCRSNTSTP
uniref:Uncharacterized protein n=1 Tax=Oryza nivara TaxID=4536 RepID=A0A0E0GPM2_ORYNI